MAGAVGRDFLRSRSARRGVLAAATIAVLAGACSSRALPDETGASTAAGSGGSTTSSTTSSTGVEPGDSTANGTTGFVTSSTGDSTGSTTIGSEPACPYTSWYMCDVAWPCSEGEPCGMNHRFDARGCPRERCDTDVDCPSGQVCRDIIACAPKGACIGPTSCDPAFGEACHCISGGSCDPERLYCFPPDEYGCDEGTSTGA